MNLYAIVALFYLNVIDQSTLLNVIVTIFLDNDDFFFNYYVPGSIANYNDIVILLGYGVFFNLGGVFFNVNYNDLSSFFVDSFFY